MKLIHEITRSILPISGASLAVMGHHLGLLLLMIYIGHIKILVLGEHLRAIQIYNPKLHVIKKLS